MRLNYTIAILCYIVIINNSFSNNLSIASYKPLYSKCLYAFEDKIGTRTFTPTSYFWDFGDGQSSNQQHALHDYMMNGTYMVKHIISDGVNKDSAVFTIHVDCYSNYPLSVWFHHYRTISPKAQFEAYYTGRPTRFFWDFGDGDTSDQINPYHEYKSNIIKHFKVTLIVWDSLSSDTFSSTLLVGPYKNCDSPKADFTYEIDTTECGLVKFTETCATPILYRFWRFGDPTDSHEKDPMHIYSQFLETTYTVFLEVWDSICRDTVYKNITVKCRDCYTSTAVIDMQVDPNDSSKAILYNNSQGVIKSHFWDFGDGNTSTLSSPTHTYTKAGKIRLKYVCTDTFNCKDSTYLFFEIDSNGHIKRGNVSFTINVVNNTNYTSLKQVYIGQPSLHIYPQPADKHVFIETSDANVYQLTVYNANGQIIETLIPNSEGKTELNTSTWQPGLYLIKDNLGRTTRLMVLH